jgi:hypothetical protein
VISVFHTCCKYSETQAISIGIIGFAIACRNRTARLGVPLVLDQPLRWSMPDWHGTALTET